MEAIQKKQVVLSQEARSDLISISIWGETLFGTLVADNYDDYLRKQITSLDQWYLMHPECRHLATKNKNYRNIITDSHLVIYRIVERVEVLRILHSSSSIASIRKVKGVKV